MKPKERSSLPKGYKELKLKCNWCNLKLLGNNFLEKHGPGKSGHDYLSYTVMAQAGCVPLGNFFKVKSKNEVNIPVQKQENVIKEEEIL